MDSLGSEESQGRLQMRSGFNKFIYIINVLYFLTVFAYCSHSHGHRHDSANEHMNQTSFEKLSESFESPERKKWQKPDEVVRMLGRQNSSGSLSGLNAADLGAGTGYFTFRLLDAGAKVTALDADERFLQFIQKKAESHPKKKNLSVRKIPYTSAELKPDETDILISVNVYHHIEDRIRYFSEIKKALKKNGFICIIDFKEGKLPIHSPPESMRISREKTVNELEQAGFKVYVDDKTLDYQYIFIGR